MRAFAISVVIIVGTMFTSYVALAWTPPPASPPGSNVEAPINTGTTQQTKVGNLVLGNTDPATGHLGVNALAVFGNTILSGVSRYLNFGTIPTPADPSTGYGIRDNAGALEFKNSGGNWQTLQSLIFTLTGGESPESVVAFSVNKGGTNQAVSPSVWAKLTWSTEVFDANSNFANNRFTPTIAGKYTFTANLWCTGVGTATCHIAIYKNGSMAHYGVSYRPIGDNAWAQVTTVLDMNGTTDYVETYGNPNEGSQFGGDARATYFTGALLSPQGSGGSQWENGSASAISYSGGNVGIGAGSPDTKLDIFGANTGNGQSNQGGSIFQIKDGSGRLAMQVNGNIDGSALPTAEAALRLGHAPVSGLSLVANGTLKANGIVSNGPNTGQGQSQQGGLILEVYDGNGRGIISARGGVDGSPLPTNAALNVGGAGVLPYSINTVHNINAGGGFSQNSDRRLKENVIPLAATSNLAAVTALNPVSFNWKDIHQRTATQFGLIAQEVQTVFPSLVLKGGTTTITLSDGSERVIPDVLSVNYTGLIPYIIESIKELANKVSETAHLVVDTLRAHRVETDELCVKDVCINRDQLAALLAQ